MGSVSGPPELRFWAKVNKHTLSGCWEWTGARLKFGHGIFWTGDRKVVAHRWAYEDAKGPIPPGLIACHHCDNPPCVNPEHIFIGTHKDNSQDAIKKGRWVGKEIQLLGAAAKRERTNCKRGHPLFGENLVVTKTRGRRCYICLIESQRKHDRKRRPGKRRLNGQSRTA